MSNAHWARQDGMFKRIGLIFSILESDDSILWEVEVDVVDITIIIIVVAASADQLHQSCHQSGHGLAQSNHAHGLRN